MIIDLVVGARPNFVKAAAIIHAAKKYSEVKINLVHTGQHRDVMSDPFFEELSLPVPSPLPVRSLSPREGVVDRLSDMMEHVGYAIEEHNPDFVMVVGDTDSTLAGALAAAKKSVPLVHVEAGLRCGDMKMQEELNRILVDAVSSIAYTTTEDARCNLIAEGFRGRIVNAGNLMVDTLFRMYPLALERTSKMRCKPYAILTMHRPETVDNDKLIFPILDAVRKVAEEIDVVFPIHPRLRSRIGAWSDNGRMSFVRPMGYLEFISLLYFAQFVMTDSGGLQEESTAFGIPCLTLRPSTERPETVRDGSNHVIGTDPEVIYKAGSALAHRGMKVIYGTPDGYDGHAAERIMEDLMGGRE